MKTYGIDFPFRNSAIGNYVTMTPTIEKRSTSKFSTPVINEKRVVDIFYLSDYMNIPK